ncbi:MAG: hypothetical protein DRO13_06815 [Thermoprotei archaeon]|nr:MAG: hypothetical protein DRO13_06815 [Thermoprotei archaeon]
MIIVSGSWLVKDAERRDDLDVVYLTWNIGKYIVLLIHRKDIEKALGKKLGIKVSFSPYIVTSPTILGNVFLAITLLRYPFHKPYMRYILKLVLKKYSRRWLLLHFAFAVLGLLSANSLRDYTKYCSMIAENLLYIENARIPNSWRDTIKMGYVVASKYKLRYLSTLLLSCIENIESIQRYMPALNVNSSQFVNVVKEYLKFIQVEDVEELSGGISDALRCIYEVIVKFLLRYNMKWRTCSSIIITLMHPKILTYVTLNSMIKARVTKLFAWCRQQIPVLSPLAHP